MNQPLPQEMLFAIAHVRQTRRVPNLGEVGEVCVGYDPRAYWAAADHLLAEGALSAETGYYELTPVGDVMLGFLADDLDVALAEHTDQQALVV